MNHYQSIGEVVASAAESTSNRGRSNLTVAVPVYNEAATVSRLLDRLYAEPTSKEIVVVDDGSTDDSGALIAEWMPKRESLNSQTTRIVHLSHRANRGKGRAIRTALEVAEGDYFLVQDADLELCPSAYQSLLSPLTEGEVDWVIGTRQADRRRFRTAHRLGLALVNSMVRLLYGYRLSDAACCYKVAETERVRAMQLQCEGFEFCPEFVAKAARLNLTVREVPVQYTPRRTQEGKKLRLVSDGLECLGTLMRYRNWQPESGPPEASRENLTASKVSSH
ncbi:glycosyltransferase family 2 protein [Roseimaritima sediminicola]|uniref:glycosyltransferase family 2 protein n=1 Tax=Roseimaritima sediminicola TaxID=2662066 RepID=UPI001298302E|nr:glycosyltransferase family 2 protein [Roseimaritima sediminicola]